MSTKKIPDGVTMFHKDTPQQVRALRRSHVARRLRKTFKPGTRVRANVGGPDMPVGIVQYTVPHGTALGGVIVVKWPNGQAGRHCYTALEIVGEETSG